MIANERLILIAAGGTGGHVIPALEVARVLRERGVEVVWIGTRRGLEARLVPAAGIVVEWLSIEGVRGKGIVSLLLAPVNIIRACWQTLSIMRRRKPGAVLGMGGFVAGPSGLAAWMTRLPLVVHEQNAIAGVTNKLLKPLATQTLQAIPGTFKTRVQTVGNPVRIDIVEQALPAERLAGREGPLRVLVVGGSQGARVFNEVVPVAIQYLTTECELRHQCGKDNRFSTEAAYAGVTRSRVRVHEFIDDMAAMLAWADVAICRSGAMTVAELAAVGVASILVPFPYAVDDHQTVNARQLVDAGAAVLKPECELTPDWLVEQLAVFANDRERVLHMAENARACARTDAASLVADTLLKVAR